MRNSSRRALRWSAVFAGACAVGAASCISPHAQPLPYPASKWNRVLIVSGGPDTEYNQYAIESNARYVASLTKNAAWRRILFADGKPTSKTISTVLDTPRTRAAAIVAWILNFGPPDEKTQLNAPTLRPINAPATPDSITQNIATFAQSVNSKDSQLVYFTGHGSPGKNQFGNDDYINTQYNSWGDDFSVRQLARELQKSKSQAPLVLVMVQCYSGGFANVLYQDGDPTKPLWSRDICGFFAAIPDRMAAGCTSQVNERDYQDFTTHFFAALSGVSRDGRKVTGADYDNNGSVSFDEAYAYAQINDDSIDVPLCTSDAFLCQVFPNDAPTGWQKTSFSRLSKDATPSQLAVLGTLGPKVKLSGQDQLAKAYKRMMAFQPEQEANSNSDDDWTPPPGINEAQFNASYDRLEKLLKSRYPKANLLHGPERSRAFETSTSLLLAQTKDLNVVYQGYTKSLASEDAREVEEARLHRFVRLGRTIILTKRLEREGTPNQKAIFARLRASESRSAF